MIKKIRDNVNNIKVKSAWDKGVMDYVDELLEHLEEQMEMGYVTEDDVCNANLMRKHLLNGAEDWKQYSWGASSLIYDREIAERLCTPSELKKTDHGNKRPNKDEEWLDTQARALSQACEIIVAAMPKKVRQTVWEVGYWRYIDAWSHDDEAWESEALFSTKEKAERYVENDGNSLLTVVEREVS